MMSLNYRDDPVLARVWYNEEDAVYKWTSGVYDTLGTAGPVNVAVKRTGGMPFWRRLRLAWKVLWG